MKKLSNLLSLAILFSSFAILQSCQQECNCDTKKGIENSGIRTGGGSQSVEIENLSVKDILISSVKDDLTKMEAIPTFELTDELKAALESGEYDILTTDIRKPQINQKASNAETAELVSSIFNSLMGAENLQAQLDVQLLMSENKVNDGMFLFSINTEEAQDLEFTIYDEEGFQTVANNKLAISKGENYKALNVETLPSGSYIFKLRNPKTQKELVKKLAIANKK